MSRNGTEKGGDGEGGRRVHWKRLISERSAAGWFAEKPHRGLSF